MAEPEPPWLTTARSFIGNVEIDGAASNPVILQWPATIAAKFPRMTGYCALFVNDDIAWCGLFEAVCFALHDIEPVFGATDTDKFLWANAWAQFGIPLDRPRVGCVVVFPRHVGFYVGESGDDYLVIGGNQSDSVKIAAFAKENVTALRWPRETATQPARAPVTSDLRRRMAAAIVAFEARRDSDGRLVVYQLPAGDGGGTYEVAGINDRYHPQDAAHLAALVRAGRHDEAETYVGEFVIRYTDAAADWSNDAGAEFFLRDCVFNRGPTGAARILQRALGNVDEDGEVGPITLGATARVPADQLLTALRAARESYERDPVGYRAQFWRGLVNRWDAALGIARQFSAEQLVVPLPPITGVPPMPTQPIPPQPGTPNAAVEDALRKITVAIRPIVSELAHGQQSSDQVRAELIRMLGGILPAAGLALPPPAATPIPPAAATSPATPIAEKPSVALSGIALAIASALQAGGVIGTPFGMGEAPTDGGTLATLVPIITGLVGATGGWGALAKVGLGIVSAFASAQGKPK